MIGECYIGDVRDGLQGMISVGVKAQTCVTSPPYWGLRDYGVPGQLGLEPTIAEYVANMVEVFRLVRDVLADDGTLWLNMGDSYCSTDKWGGGGTGNAGKHTVADDGSVPSWAVRERKTPQTGLKPKDLCGIPWRVAFALQAEGWYLRQDIIWAKPNPMPESVTDRCTKSHEYLFLLSQRERYYFDAAAIAEPTNWPEGSWGRSKCYDGDETGKLRSFYGEGAQWKGGETRNKRSVWTVTTQPYSEAHFATFPPKLIEPCILAGSRVGDVVLDPFMGSGTVGQVSQALGRRWIGCELNPDYVKLQGKRTAQGGLELHA